MIIYCGYNVGVVKMADFKQRMSRHLRSARQWLTRAEESFEKESDIRGELDLMLAQAELQHARETKAKGQWRYKPLLLRQGLAIGFAMLIAVGGISGAYLIINDKHLVTPAPIAVELGKRSASSPEPKAKLENAVVPVVSTDQTGRTPVAVEKSPSVANPEQPTSLKTTDRQETSTEQRRQEADKADKAVDLPPEEMQKLMRAAGKTLRGQ